jgi:hypothetical protein
MRNKVVMDKSKNQIEKVRNEKKMDHIIPQTKHTHRYNTSCTYICFCIRLYTYMIKTLYLERAIHLKIEIDEGMERVRSMEESEMDGHHISGRNTHVLRTETTLALPSQASPEGRSRLVDANKKNAQPPAE